MLKKMRCIYWKQRDKGKGWRCLLASGMMLFLFVLLIICSIRAGIRMGNHRESVSGTAVTSSSASGSSASGTAVSEGAAEGTDREDVEERHMEEDPDTGNSEQGDHYHLDTEGISSLSGFMSDTAYEKLVSQLTAECEKKQIRSIRRLDYQKTSDTWQVTSWLLASDGSVWEMGYNLKNSAVTLTETSLSEQDVSDMKKTEEKREADKLKKKRKAAKKKQEETKKKAVKKKKTKKQTG